MGCGSVLAAGARGGGLKLCRLPSGGGGVQVAKGHPLEEPLRLPGMAGGAAWLPSLTEEDTEGLKGEGTCLESPACRGRAGPSVPGRVLHCPQQQGDFEPWCCLGLLALSCTRVPLTSEQVAPCSGAASGAPRSPPVSLRGQGPAATSRPLFWSAQRSAWDNDFRVLSR